MPPPLSLSWRSPRLLAVLGTVLVLLVATGAYVAWRHERRTGLVLALDLLPAASLRVGYTDWAAARERLHPARVTTRAGVESFMSHAYDRDLSAASSIDESAGVLQSRFGFGPGNAAWEAYAQSRQGAAMLLRVGDDVDLDQVADRLAGLGYRRPSSEDGVWRGGADLVASIDSSLTAEVQYVVIDRDRHLVISSDTASYAATAARVARGDGPSLAGSDLAGLAGRLRQPAAAFLWRSSFACEDLSMAQADPDDRAQGERLVRQDGGVDSLDGLVVALGADRRLQVGFGFENGSQAEANLRPRARLFVGPSVVRDGSYADDLRLTRTRTSGPTVLFDIKEKASDDGTPLSEMSQGPVLFATC